MLFDGPVALDAVQREHDAFVATLRGLGAQVEYVEDLLAEALEAPGERARLLRELAGEAPAAVGERLAALPAARLACRLIGGVAAEGPTASVRRLPGASAWHVPPLPNLLFPRDILAVLGDRVHVARPARAARRTEGTVAASIAHTDPALRAAGRWSEHELSVEGGDVLLAGDGVAVIGIGPRTRSSAAKALARRLLGEGGMREVIAACMPSDGPFHLDLALTMLDHDAVLIDRAVVGRTHAVRWRAGHPPLPHPSLLGALRDALGRDLRVVEAGEDGSVRPWDRGANVVAVRPGAVVAYADNRLTNRRLERAGIEVHGVAGAELGRGRGGPRCLTCPLVRGA
ncbi:MAG TPA: arginine deiminase family protein [Solirubrobacteraceae bacterium]|jgi:arginine deiminase